jgi:hypothetical protein
MALDGVQTLPPDFEKRLRKALTAIRIGDYNAADKILERLSPYLPSGDDVDLARIREENEYHRLRLATLMAEAAEYRGLYEKAENALKPYEGIVAELKEQKGCPSEELRFNGERDPRRLLLRQKLYFIWQKSVWLYRTGKVSESRELLDVAMDLGTRLHPPSEALCTQLFYGAGKLAFHECKDAEAFTMYRQSLMSASERFDIARAAHEKAPNNVSMKDEVKAARYSVAKTLALGLAQCLREDGKLEQAHSQVVAGRLLLNLGEDRELALYAQVLLCSIERSLFGENNQKRLDLIAEQIAECAEHFKDHHGEIGYRSRLEVALIKMQRRSLAEARRLLEEMLESTKTRRKQIDDVHKGDFFKKWEAEINLALSRCARRAGDYGQAVEYANDSVKAAEHDGLQRIKRRAQVVLVLALYDHAIQSDNDKTLLDQTMKKIDHALDPKWDPDVRTRANMLLTRARVQNVRGEVASALETFRRYKALEPQVEVGRIKELAEEVQKELTAEMFRCPADLDGKRFDFEHNLNVLRAHLIQRAGSKYFTAADQAKALNIARSSLYKHIRELKRLQLLPKSYRMPR